LSGDYVLRNHNIRLVDRGHEQADGDDGEDQSAPFERRGGSGQEPDRVRALAAVPAMEALAGAVKPAPRLVGSSEAGAGAAPAGNV